MKHRLKEIVQAAAAGGLLGFWSPGGAVDNSPRRKPWEEEFSNKAKAPDGAADDFVDCHFTREPFSFAPMGLGLIDLF